jgi:hypothetical protein
VRLVDIDEGEDVTMRKTLFNCILEAKDDCPAVLSRLVELGRICFKTLDVCWCSSSFVATRSLQIYGRLESFV